MAFWRAAAEACYPSGTTPAVHIASSPTEPSPPGAAVPLGTRFFLLGFLTLSVQVVLLRELYSVLYGSDLTFGFALAAWTVLTAAGALLAASSKGGPPWVGRWGLAAYSLVGIAVFLAVRAWGAMEVIPFHSYLLIPLFLAPPCLLGGMLFPWFLAETPGLGAPRAYGWEVAGGLAAGLACAVEFQLGALACPFLLGLALLAVVWGVGLAVRWERRVAGVLTGLVMVVLPLSSPGQALEKLSLRLRLRQGHIEAAVNTPFVSLVAVRDEAGQPAVYENGTPWPLPEYTAARAAVAAVLQALPGGCDRAVFIHALRAGFGPVLSAAPWVESPRFLETDPLAVAFVCRHLGGSVPGGRPLRFSARTLQPDRAGWDLVAVLSPGPGGLQANRPLTQEFAALVRPRLSPRGVFVIALPAAPGFTHPVQEAYIETVAQALRTVFPAFCELRTQVGWTLLVASMTRLDREAAARRLAAGGRGVGKTGALQEPPEGVTGAAPGVLAEALGILSGAGAVSLGELAGAPAAATSAGSGAPANRVWAPRAYFRFLQFRGRLVEDAPGWWQWLFRERGAASCMGVLAGLLAAGALGRRGRGLRGVFWAAWSATLTLILALYLYQSLTGEAFWAVALLSAASLVGILGGTKMPRGQVADWAAAGLAWIPAALFPLYASLQHWPGGLMLALLLGLVAAAGAGLGYVFARRSAAGDGVGEGGALFAVDLLGAGAGLFLGGVLLPWWSGFEMPTFVVSLITFIILAKERVAPT